MPGDAPWDSHRKLDTSRGSVVWASTMAASMEGTAIAPVIFSAWTRSSVTLGSKAGWTTLAAPTQITDRVQYTPAAWNMGAIVR